MHRHMGQPSLAESLLPQTLGRNERLERFASLVEEIYSSVGGRPSYPPLTMVKVLLLEQWYNLSDPQMEESLSDRISFRRLVGLGLEDDTPDHSIISLFRSELVNRELGERLFEELEWQLDKRSLMLKEGTLKDATLVESQVRRPPRSAARGSGNPKDPDVGWTYSGRGSRTHFGYKVHVGVDAGTGLVRKAELTSAKVYESEVADNLVSADEGAIYADRAYESKRRRRWLRSIGNKGPHHASFPQPSVRVASLAEASQRVDRSQAQVGREGVRHPQAQLRLQSCPLPRSGAKRGADVVQTDGVQLQESSQANGLSCLNTEAESSPEAI